MDSQVLQVFVCGGDWSARCCQGRIVWGHAVSGLELRVRIPYGLPIRSRGHSLLSPSALSCLAQSTLISACCQAAFHPSHGYGRVTLSASQYLDTRRLVIYNAVWLAG